jgi:hypothetical protein
MNKLLAALIAGLFAVSVNAFAADIRTANETGGLDKRISGENKKNTNSPNATDRDKGQERAGERRSAEGQEHQKATEAHEQHGDHDKNGGHGKHSGHDQPRGHGKNH